MIYILWMCMIVIPYICGKFAIKILYKSSYRAEMTKQDYFISGVAICICMAEIVHFCSVFGSLTVTEGTFAMGAIYIIATLISAFGLLIKKYGLHLPKHRVNSGNRVWFDSAQGTQKRPVAFYIGFMSIVLFIIEFIITQVGTVYADGDMTLETVNTFISTDSYYSVNPVTGADYELGIPARLKILCLPGLYSFMVKAFHMNGADVVWRAVPGFVLLSAAVAYYSLAGTLYAGDGYKRNMFMVLVAVVLLAGNYMYGMDGFLALGCGYRGVAIRALILVPYTISLSLRKKWIMVLICILAETSVVWTFYGAGVCLFVALGIAITGIVLKRIASGKGADS